MPAALDVWAPVLRLGVLLLLLLQRLLMPKAPASPALPEHVSNKHCTHPLFCCQQVLRVAEKDIRKRQQKKEGKKKGRWAASCCCLAGGMRC